MTESMIDRPRVDGPRTPLEDTIIYELHVRGYTVDPSSGVRYPGTYAGLAEKVDELADLGITAVELLPVDEFDENDCQFVNPMTGEKLRNFWGYNPIVFCCAEGRLCHNPERLRPLARVLRVWSTRSTRRESRSILDVVFNHTAEGGEDGPTSAFAASTTRSITCSTTRAAT